MNSKSISSLPSGKIKINWNKNPIKMEEFLSFLSVKTEVPSYRHGEYFNGWTEKVNEEHNLIIRGGIVNGIEYLDSIQYGKRMQNPWNNYVNPFALFDIMNEEGKMFFINFYRENILGFIEKSSYTIECLKQRIKEEEEIITTLESLINENKTD